MVLLTLRETFDIIVMTLALGFIFNDVFGRYKPVKHDYDPLENLKSNSDYWSGFKFACLVTAPAIILHELGHKAVALAMGFAATFHAAYTWLGLGVLLKLMNFGFIFFVPAYVSHSANTTPLQSAAISFAGPLVNLFLWLGPWYLLKYYKPKKSYVPFLTLTKQINMFLFIFNMIPLGFFDGAKVVTGIMLHFIG